MTKKTSSASAGTRKKNARKAAKGGSDAQEDEGAPQHSQKTQQGKNKKLSKAQKRALPKAKRYIPPPKPPAPPIPNPLDSQGLAGQLPAELVVALRGIGKKDDVTRRKALEELKDVWVAGVVRGDGDEVEKEVNEAALVSSTPVWVSLVPKFQHAELIVASQFSESATIAFPPYDGTPATRRAIDDTFNTTHHPRNPLTLPLTRDPEQGHTRGMARHIAG